MNTNNYKLVLNKIKSCPDSWDQKAWHCGTQHCFAGHAQILAGKEPNHFTVRRDARQFLELTQQEANYLFSPERTLENFENFLRVGPYRNGYDRDGYDRNGYDREGYYRNGYDRNGYDREGYDRNGYYRNGYDRNGYDREGYDRNGYDREGYDRDGYDTDGLDRNLKTRGEA